MRRFRPPPATLSGGAWYATFAAGGLALAAIMLENAVYPSWGLVSGKGALSFARQKDFDVGYAIIAVCFLGAALVSTRSAGREVMAASGPTWRRALALAPAGLGWMVFALSALGSLR